MKIPQFLFSSILATLALLSGALAQSPVGQRSASAAVPAAVSSPIIVASAGPTSPLYLTDPNHSTNWVVQGNSVINSWPQHHSGECPIAVAGTVRTVGSSLTDQGSEYTLSGMYTGVNYASVASGLFYDGTTDGNLIYSVNYIGGGVYSFNADWTNPTLLFSTPANYVGITFDLTNNSLWLTSSNSTIENRSLTGNVLSSFTVPFGGVSFLALDPADSTLWMGSVATQGTFYQYTKTGLPLGSVTYPELAGHDIVAAEFSIDALRQGHVFGQGTIDSPDGGQASFMIDVRNDNKKGRVTGRVSYSDPAANLSMSTGQITYLVINGRTAGIAGSATVPGKKKSKRLSFTIHVADNGSGSTDTFSIVFDNGYSASGTLTSGDITVD